MKKQKRFMMLLVGVFLMLFSMGTKAQTYSSKITGAAQVSCNMFEFDLVIQRTGTTVLQLAMYQAGININPDIIPAGATINVSMVPGSSALSTNMKPTADRFSFDALRNCIILTPMSPAYANRTTISNAPTGTKVCRFRVACSQPFLPGATNVAWAWAMAQGYQTKVFAYVGTINTDITNQAWHYLVAPYNTTLVNSSAVTPAVSSISTDMTEVCTNPGNGATITVDASTNYCSYYLYKDGLPVPGVGAVAYGNGGPVSFSGLQTNGVFTVKSPSCSGLVDMGNDVTIIGLTPLVQTLSISPDPASILGGDITFTTTAGNAAPGNWFDWFVNDVPMGVYDPTFTYTPTSGDVVYADMNSDGSMCISLASQIVNSQSVKVYVGPPLDTFDISGSASVCQGATPAITLSGSQSGYDYQLFRNGIAYQAAMPGTGFPLIWTVTDAGNYTCKVVWPVTEMRFTATIIMNPILTPIFTQVAPICAGETLAALPTTSNNGVTGTWAPALDNMLTTLYTFTPDAGQCAIPATMTIVVNQPVIPTFAPVAAICAGGTLAPLPTTSINGVTGTWAPALDNMNTTLYTFTPTAGLCATQQTLSIVVDQPIVPTFAPVAAICAGATLDPLPTTSINGVTGTWAPALDNMNTTLYTFTPTAGLCATTQTLSIVVNQPVVPTFAPVAAICAGATLDPLPTTSINGVTGTWAPALDNMNTTLYTFTPTAGLCATTQTLSIVVNQPVVPTFAPVAAICAGETLAPLPTTSIEGVTGTWAPALDNMNTTLYTFTPTAGLCATTQTLSIVVNQPVVPTFAPVAPICEGGSLSALPITSIEGVAGTWAPALDNMNTTLYTFTPTAGLCATTATMTIVVNPAPAPPTTLTPLLTACASALPAILVDQAGPGLEINWYDAATAGNLLLANSATYQTSLAGTYYNGTYDPATGCYSLTRTAAQLVVNPNPEPPTTLTPNVSACANALPVELIDVAPAGLQINWFDAAIGGNLLIANSATYNAPAAGTFWNETFDPITGCYSVTRTPSVLTVNAVVTPTFTQVAPINKGDALAPLPTTSLNGITGTWAPAMNNQATTLYTFTPAAGQCANQATMTIVVNDTPPVTEFEYTQDIGTTLLAAWPAVAGAGIYGFQYRPFGSTGAWVGVGSTTNYVKVTNLIPGQHYECRVKAYLPSGSPLPGFQYNEFTTTPCAFVKDLDMGSASKMSWDDYSPWATSYAIQYKKVGGSWTTLASYMPYSKLATEPGANYVCQVKVYKGGSLWGTTAEFAFTTDSYSYAVTNNTGTALDLTWTDFNLNDPSAPWVTAQYLRYRVAGSTGAWIQKTVAAGAYTYHVTGLTANTNYEFQIHVYLPAFWGTTPLGFFNTNTIKSLNADNSNNSINIYPNPFVDQVNMDLFTEQGTTVTWNVYDMTGKVVLSGSESITSGSSTLNIDGANLPKGVYMLNAIMNDQMQSFRILKQ